MLTEADTCRKFILPKLQEAGWDTEPHSLAEQRPITDGRVVLIGDKAHRRQPKRPDYLLRYTSDFTIAVVEAKSLDRQPTEGVQQAKEYALMLGLQFAYSTNGEEIIEFDFATGKELRLTRFPSPEELWKRYCAAQGITKEDIASRLLTRCFGLTDKKPRFYQEIAINRAVQSILQGRKRVLLTMATGTGKTLVAFQICWKLWESRWNRTGDHRRPRILYLADRNILIDDPKDKMFVPFGDARHRVENGEVVKSREMYFAIYQAIAQDERRPGLYKEFGRDFFDLIIVDECHRGSAGDESNWRAILEFFNTAYQLGMTATPKRNDNVDTYAYFGNPVYEYSLKQGIEDGFLAPYRVHRIVSEWDAAGWRPNAGTVDRHGREIPDDEYHTKDFERTVAMRARTQAIARHLTDFLKRTNRFAKTIVFCVDQEHADEMRQALSNLNADLMRQYPDYVCRVTSDEGTIGRGYLDRFKELETDTPVILTTSQLLTTGVDIPTCRNIVLARVVGSMTEFKQIIGRGSRIREDYGKLWFTILDYTGSATAHFADPEFDGTPALLTEEDMDAEGAVLPDTYEIIEETVEQVAEEQREYQGVRIGDDFGQPRRKYYFDGGQVEIATEIVYELDPNTGKQLRVVRYTDYAAEQVRTLYANSLALFEAWANPEHRESIKDLLAERGVDFEHLQETAHQPDADPLDLLCHLAFNAPLRTRRERADRLKKERRDFFDQYSLEARAILEELLEKYAAHGPEQLRLPEVLQVPPISTHGNIMEIAEKFGGAENLRTAVNQLHSYLYVA